MNTAILDVRPAVATASGEFCRSGDLVRLLSLDQLADMRRALACHWHRDDDGHLTCAWAPDVASVASPNTI